MHFSLMNWLVPNQRSDSFRKCYKISISEPYRIHSSISFREDQSLIGAGAMKKDISADRCLAAAVATLPIAAQDCGTLCAQPCNW